MEPMHGAPRLSVLAVDDHLDTVESLVELLTLLGYHSRAATTGEDALAMAAESPPDVVLLDMHMPGMDGWELGRRLACGPKPPILVAVTGCDREEDRRRSADAGIHLHLLKPVEPGVLAGMLKRFERTLAPAEPEPVL
ncbi:response regulator [Fimbriiglobus ruber]|uniref:Chemotaxis protein methyltransferase CheR n=1 Tax=Fimbriiglobus ruber TaxID=1908690 RepID=A0A225DQ33_9BACT|nr:response regulator [Fimbriiglobus ruber]OWK43381.1 Chemotaxis protein methyltransferase CheR [Fimbriiglobus ruber]